MNDFGMANNAWKRWIIGKSALEALRKMGRIEHAQHISAQAVIANKDYVCYLAQEWAGARK